MLGKSTSSKCHKCKYIDVEDDMPCIVCEDYSKFELRVSIGHNKRGYFIQGPSGDRLSAHFLTMAMAKEALANPR